MRAHTVRHLIDIFQYISNKMHSYIFYLYIFQYTRISNKMHSYIFYLYLETALRFSGGISTHHQEHTQLYLQHLAHVKPLLLPATIVEELELQFQLFHDSRRWQ
jgi:hypothetical protein